MNPGHTALKARLEAERSTLHQITSDLNSIATVLATRRRPLRAQAAPSDDNLTLHIPGAFPPHQLNKTDWNRLNTVQAELRQRQRASADAVRRLEALTDLLPPGDGQEEPRECGVGGDGAADCAPAMSLPEGDDVCRDDVAQGEVALPREVAQMLPEPVGLNEKVERVEAKGNWFTGPVGTALPLCQGAVEGGLKGREDVQRGSGLNEEGEDATSNGAELSSMVIMDTTGGLSGLVVGCFTLLLMVMLGSHFYQ